VFTKQISQTIEELEKLLLIWMNVNMFAGNSVSEWMICEKARRLHDDLIKNILVRVLILMFLKLAEGGSRNLRKEMAYIVWLGMGRLRVRTKKLQSSGVQEQIYPYYINSYGENSFGLRTTFRNELSS
jgi:hypothetical protein